VRPGKAGPKGGRQCDSFRNSVSRPAGANPAREGAANHPEASLATPPGDGKRRCVRTQAREPRRASFENTMIPGAQGFDYSEGHGELFRDGEDGRTRRGEWTRRARRGRPRNLGEPHSSSNPFRQSCGAPVTNSPNTPHVGRRKRDVAKKRRLHRGRPKARGTIAEADGDEVSEGCI